MFLGLRHRGRHIIREVVVDIPHLDIWTHQAGEDGHAMKKMGAKKRPGIDHHGVRES